MLVSEDLEQSRQCSYCGEVKFEPDITELDNGCVLWRCQKCGTPIKLSYSEDAWDRSLFRMKVLFHIQGKTDQSARHSFKTQLRV